MSEPIFEPGPTNLPPLPVPNLPLLRKVLDHIDAHPDEWNQNEWGIQTERSSCGTAFCIAGHVAVMSGAEPVWDIDGSMVHVRRPNGQPTPVGVYAAEQLGITWEESGSGYVPGLFAGHNTREDIQRIAERIAERAGEVL